MSILSSLSIVEGKHCPQLSSLTTIQLGGQPQYYYKATSEEEAISCARWSKEQNIKFWVIGGGSNVVCDDQGLEGLVLQPAIESMIWEEQEDQASCLVTVGAGIEWHHLVEESVKRNLAGVECLVGIPGWVGAAPIQNIGAYGQSFDECCTAVKVYDLQEDELKWWSKVQCAFGYRTSLFKKEPGRYLILAVKLTLKRKGKATLKYKQLVDRLAQTQQEPSLRLVASLVKTLRAEKSMLWNEEDSNHRSVGSFFTNPCLSPQQMEWLLSRCHTLGKEGLPQWPSGQEVKTSAAWLIEQSGFHKGYNFGQVGLSSKHCLALINRGNGQFSELLNFAKYIQRQVWSTFKVWLEPEARIFTSSVSDPLRFRPKIALATCQNLPDWEVDDHPLWSALQSYDIDLAHPSWDDPEVDWRSFDLVLPRTTWDYQEKWSTFLSWLDHVHQVTTLENPYKLMSWNLNKTYLKELEIEQPPVCWLEQRSLNTQDELLTAIDEIKSYCSDHRWSKAFIKPSIGASAVGTLRFSLSDPSLSKILKTYLQEWLPKRTLLLQPYIEDVETTGECSLIYFGGEFSHAVRKVPVKGDYRVQDDYGASDMPWEAPEEWKSQCMHMLRKLPEMPLYARCDFLHGPHHQAWLIELELIEPSLFFRHDPQSPQRFAKVLVDRCMLKCDLYLPKKK